MHVAIGAKCRLNRNLNVYREEMLFKSLRTSALSWPAITQHRAYILMQRVIVIYFWKNLVKIGHTIKRYPIVFFFHILA